MHDQVVDDAVEIIDVALADLAAAGYDPLDRAAALIASGLAEIRDIDERLAKRLAIYRLVLEQSGRPGPGWHRPRSARDAQLMPRRHLRLSLAELVRQRPEHLDAKSRRELRRRQQRQERQDRTAAAPHPNTPAPEENDGEQSSRT